MWTKIDPETKFGGIFGIIAIVAIVTEVIFNGITPGTVAGGIKDFAGVMVGVAVLIVAVRSLMPRKKPTGFSEALEENLNRWEAQSEPLIHRAVDCPDKIRYYLLTDLERVFTIDENDLDEIRDKGPRRSGVFNGRFVEIPPGIPDHLTFFLNKSTFGGRNRLHGGRPEDTLELLAAKISENVNKNFRDFCKSDSAKDTITVRLNKTPDSQEDAARIVKIISHVLTLYTIAY